ncbi:flotillin family protein [Brachybacterium halotolerans subsp. kimchii]|uniref:SPFH domain-containing protein n=1 Tax=Brachybacterium halotolerans TaxID=2795215 RepID=UPI001E4F7163|nr:SPFH domain-containing protein [Brachybacterium halotolerans]UEJ81822.1 flotillin family protein [Brachybacterium halotolerans subsp. kimchii]
MGSTFLGIGIAGFIAVVVVALLVIAVIAFFLVRGWIKVARADEALVISGKSQKNEDGSTSATTVVVNGKAIVNPITQRHEVISLRQRQVNMRAEAQSSDNVTLAVEAVALVKIGSDRELVRRAAERFASQDEAIESFTQDQLEGVLRGVIAQQSVISLMRDRKVFSEQIAETVIPELREQGLILDSFQIRGITDGVGYIQSLGAPEIEDKRQAAEISQTNAERAVAKERIRNEEQNLVEQQALDTNKANAQAEVGRAQAQAEQAQALAGEKSRQEVLQQQAENKQAQLDADVKRVADAELYRRQKDAEAAAFEQRRQAEARAEVAEADARAVKLRAEADAESQRLAGEARADAMRAEAEALRENQEALLAQRVVDQLPTLMETFAKGYAQIGEITVVSSGGNDGDVAGKQFSGESAGALRGVFDTVEATLGLSIPDLIQGRVAGEAQGRAQGAALGEALRGQGASGTGGSHRAGGAGEAGGAGAAGGAAGNGGSSEPRPTGDMGVQTVDEAPTSARPEQNGAGTD